MIVKMSKYAFMVYHKEYDAFLKELRNLGVLHVKEINSIRDNADLQTLLAERKRLTQAIRFCEGVNKHSGRALAPAGNTKKEEGLRLEEQLEAMQEKKHKLLTAKAGLEKDIAYMELWGDFDFKNIRLLKEAGYELTFFSCPTSHYEPKWNEEYNAFLVNNVQSVTYFVTVTKVGTSIEIDAERAKMPSKGLSELQSDYDRLGASIKALEKETEEFSAQHYAALVEADRQVQDEFNYRNVWAQTDHEAEDRLMVLEGFVPTEEAPVLEAGLEQKGYYFQQLAIEEEENVPIKLRNNAFSRLFEPITRMFSLPNYTEFDPTPFFAPFFMLFFGLCFGDGGYGLLVILACAYFKRKASRQVKDYLSLFQYFGLAALIVGTCTGSFFGIALASVPALVAVKDYFVSSDNLMTFSIIIGLVQIVFGKTVAALKTMEQKGTKYGIAPMAWVFVIVALLCALGLPMLNVQLPEVVKNVCFGITGAGLLVAFFYNSPGKNIFLNFGTGLWNTYNMASGLLGDTLSYIRLFAIGLTGSILGGVFNSLAIDMTEGMNIFLRIIVMLLILVAGHAINFGLCTISSLVHPLRLIFVEYYKNAEFEGGGKDYRPFKKA